MEWESGKFSKKKCYTYWYILWIFSFPLGWDIIEEMMESESGGMNQFISSKIWDLGCFFLLIILFSFFIFRLQMLCAVADQFWYWIRGACNIDFFQVNICESLKGLWLLSCLDRSASLPVPYAADRHTDRQNRQISPQITSWFFLLKKMEFRIRSGDYSDILRICFTSHICSFITITVTATIIRVTLDKQL